MYIAKVCVKQTLKFKHIIKSAKSHLAKLRYGTKLKFGWMEYVCVGGWMGEDVDVWVSGWSVNGECNETVLLMEAKTAAAHWVDKQMGDSFIH